MATKKKSTGRKPMGAHTALALLPVAVGLIPHTTTPTPASAPSAHTATVAHCGQHCGTERWPIKTMSDPEASKVHLVPQQTTVAELIAADTPNSSSNDERLNDFEKQVFRVKAKLVGYKQELDSKGKGDHDFHIVIQDLDTDDTMIIEIPAEECDGVCNSTQKAKIVKARKDFLAAVPDHPPSATFVVLDDPQPVIEVTGVGLYDFFHGQTGVAKNCLELHPVLTVKFPAPGTFTAKHDPKREPPKTPKEDHNCIAE